MAIDLSALFGQQPDYSAFISPAEQQRLQSNAGQQALLNAAISALSMTGRTREPISTGQVLAGALGAGMEGYNQSFDRTLKQMVTGMQLAEFKKKQDAQKRYQELVKGATTQVPQPIPMATGQGSQLEMLTRPEFGGDMATAETVAALKGNLPTKQQIDLEKLQSAVMQYLAETSPEKFAELTTKQAKLPTKIDEFITAKQMKLIPENMTYQQFEEIGKKPMVQIMPTEKNLAEIDKGVVENLTNQAVSARQFATSATQINELLKGKGGGAAVKLTTDIAKNLGFNTETVTANDLAKSLVVQTAVKVRPPGSGATSNIEFESYINAVPSLANSESGRALMADANRRFAERAEKIADFSRNLYKNNNFNLTAVQEYDAKLGAVLPKDFFDQVNKIPKTKDLGIPSAKGVRFLGFEQNK
jgi:hypothetical protein